MTQQTQDFQFGIIAKITEEHNQRTAEFFLPNKGGFADITVYQFTRYGKPLAWKEPEIGRGGTTRNLEESRLFGYAFNLALSIAEMWNQETGKEVLLQ